MTIGGFTAFSLSDFPGCVAAVVFAQGCNFRCPFCHNAALLPAEASPETLLPAASVLADLASRRGLLDGVVVSGGEPTLQAALPTFLEGLKGMGFAVKLDTNGSRPPALRSVLDARLVDYVAMDVKAPLAIYARLAGCTADVEAIQESLGLIASSRLPHEFRTTFVPQLMAEEDLTAIRAMLPARSLHRIQPFRAQHALDSALRTE